MNKTAIVIGSLVLAGIGAFFYFKPKKEDLTELQGELSQEQGQGQVGTGGQSQTTSNPSTPPVLEPAVKPISPNDLLEVSKLKDAILADISKRNSYRKASSRANVQAQIDEKLEKLKTYGFSLNTNNELIKTS